MRSLDDSSDWLGCGVVVFSDWLECCDGVADWLVCEGFVVSYSQQSMYSRGSFKDCKPLASLGREIVKWKNTTIKQTKKENQKRKDTCYTRVLVYYFHSSKHHI